jgi:hypothetical protein
MYLKKAQTNCLGFLIIDFIKNIFQPNNHQKMSSHGKSRRFISDNQLIFRVFLMFLYVFLHFIIAFYVNRTETLFLISCLTGLYLIYFYFIFQHSPSDKVYWFTVLMSKVIWCASIPMLSDDYFRFLWDGILIDNDINPFLHPPSYYIENLAENPFIDQTLYYSLNSPHYYSVYPPICQVVFWFSASIGKTGNWFVNILIIRICLIVVESIGLIYLSKLLKKLKKPTSWVFWYALNPLIIIEITGNLHFEGLMLGFLIIAFYLLTKDKYYQSTLFFTFSVCTKLLPLILLPFIVKQLGVRKGIKYISLVGLFCLLLFIPFLSYEMLLNLSDSLSLYFQKFEFNASIYYIFRGIGYWFSGYNMINVIGFILPVFSLAIIIFLIIKSTAKNWSEIVELSLFVWVLYILFSTTVHPWYITPLIFFASITGYISPLIWSFLVFWSYHAYSDKGVNENLWIVALEYVIFLVLFFLEFRNRLISKTADIE